MQCIPSIRFPYLNVSVELLHNLLFLLVTHINLLHVILEICVLVCGQLFYLKMQGEG